LDQKQQKLENLSHQNYKFDSDYSIPNSLKNIINKIDCYVSNTLVKGSEEDLLPANIMKNFSKQRPIKKQILTEKKKTAISLLQVSLKLFEFRKNSFGLFLCSTLVFYLRLQSKPSEKNRGNKQKMICLDFENNSYSFERTSFVSILVNEVIKFTQASKSLVENQFLEEAIKIKSLRSNEKENDKILSRREKIKLVKETLEPSKYSFYKFLTSNKQLEKMLYLKNQETQTVQFEIGIILLTFLDSVGLILDNETITNKYKSGIKMTSIIKISSQYIESIFQIPCRMSSLPLVAEPKYWVKDNSHSKQNFGKGGFHYNVKENTQGLLGYKRVIARLTDQEIESMNYLQSNVYNINKNFLTVMKINAVKCFYIYTLNSGLVHSKFIENIDDNENMFVRSSQSFIEQSQTYQELKREIYDSDNKDIMLQRLRKVKKSLQEEYNKYTNKLIEFISLYYIATLFQDYNIYFVVNLDSRGRFYYSQARGSFGLQAGEMSKHVIELVGNAYNKSNVNSFVELDYKSTQEIYAIRKPTWQEISEDDESAVSGLKKYYGIKSSFVGADAHCSGTSIISGLIGFEKGLRYTNIICDLKKDQNKLCIYNYFSEHLLQHTNSMEDIFSKDFIVKSAKTNKLSQTKFRKILECIYQKIKSSLIVRHHVKFFVMCQNYAQQNQGRAKYIDGNFLHYYLIVENPIGMANKIDYKLRMKISFKIAEWIEKNYKLCFPELDEFTSIVKNKLSHKIPFKLCAGLSQIGKFEIQINKSKIVKARKPNFNSNDRKKMSQLSYHVSLDTINQRKSSIASISNFIHFLDSRLCSQVIYKCLENDIIIWTNHDCFYTARENINLVKKLYFESYVEILLQSNTCSKFFNANDLTELQIVKKFLKKTSAQRKRMDKEIKKGNWIMSEHILS